MYKIYVGHAIRLSFFFFFTTLLILSGCTKKEEVEGEHSKASPKIERYSFAINTKEWCWDYPNNKGLYGFFVRLSQVVDGYAIFTGKGFKIAIPRDQLSEELAQGQTIDDLAKYIGFVKKIKMQNMAGFEVDVEMFHVISESKFRSTEQRVDRNSCRTI